MDKAGLHNYDKIFHQQAALDPPLNELHLAILASKLLSGSSMAGQ